MGQISQHVSTVFCWFVFVTDNSGYQDENQQQKTKSLHYPHMAIRTQGSDASFIAFWKISVSWGKRSVFCLLAVCVVLMFYFGFLVTKTDTEQLYSLSSLNTFSPHLALCHSNQPDGPPVEYNSLSVNSFTLMRRGYKKLKFPMSLSIKPFHFLPSDLWITEAPCASILIKLCHVLWQVGLTLCTNFCTQVWSVTLSHLDL